MFDPNKDIDGCGTVNETRALTAAAGVEAACRFRNDEPIVDADSVQDLLADIGHLCDQEGLGFEALIDWAKRRWQEER